MEEFSRRCQITNEESSIHPQFNSNPLSNSRTHVLPTPKTKAAAQAKPTVATLASSQQKWKPLPRQKSTQFQGGANTN